MTRILVTGSEGQLGSSIRKISGDYPESVFTFIDIKDLDLTAQNEVSGYFSSRQFNYIINCAAYTSVDQAEKDSSRAFAVNAGIPFILSRFCTDSGMRLIHISTDYIYDGNKATPHLEDDEPKPFSTYAKSKLEGEKPLRSNPLSLIIRTSWLYSEYGNNFLKTMIRLSNEKAEIGVVYDQVGTPTYASDLARVILTIIKYSDQNGFKPGIVNYSNEGVCSWYDFATEIMKLIRSNCTIKPIRTHEYPLPARRPSYSVMDKSKIKRIFGIGIPHWTESLKIAIQKLETGKA